MLFAATFGFLCQGYKIHQIDGSVPKHIDMTERMYSELRFEAFNAFNHPTFAPPKVTATNAALGTITAIADKSRTVQLGGQLVL